MDILGHSQIAVTMNIYGHVMPAMQQEAAGHMDAALTTDDGWVDRAMRLTTLLSALLSSAPKRNQGT